MDERPAQPREVALPASALPTLRSALRREVDALKVTHSFHAAGFAAGADVYSSFVKRQGGVAPDAIPQSRFWESLSDFFVRTGWGSLQHSQIHPGLGMLEARDWAEVGESSEPDESGCAFSSGLLAAILGQIADGPVAVLEVACRGRRAEACQFVFGSDATIHDLYGLLLEGHSFDSALDLL